MTIDWTPTVVNGSQKTFVTKTFTSLSIIEIIVCHLQSISFTVRNSLWYCGGRALGNHLVTRKEEIDRLAEVMRTSSCMPPQSILPVRNILVFLAWIPRVLIILFCFEWAISCLNSHNAKGNTEHRDQRASDILIVDWYVLGKFPVLFSVQLQLAYRKANHMIVSNHIPLNQFLIIEP